MTDEREGGERMKGGYTIKNTGAQIVKAPKSTATGSGVRAIRGQDLRCAKANKTTKNSK